MIFDLFNAPAIFQKYVNKILAKKLNIFIIIYLDNIFIYTKNSKQPHVKAVCWVLNQFWKHSLLANLKKCQFHQNKNCFLEYIILLKKISIKVKKIEVVKYWPKPKSVYNIQVFIGFSDLLKASVGQQLYSSQY